MALGESVLADQIVLTTDDLLPLPSGLTATPGIDISSHDHGLLIADERNDSAARLLRRFDRLQDINGHRNVIYDNRDRGHSRLQPAAFPSLTHLRYGPELQGRDVGLALDFTFGAFVLGNSSMAVTGGPNPRSLPRLAMTWPEHPERIAGVARSNALYVYPEHRDHDEADLYPANWAYTVTTQGSSGSDQPFLDAFALTVAALPRDTFDTLVASGLMVPTLQMILRRNLRGVNRGDQYFSSAAHPTVFDARALRPERMIGQAAAMRPHMIPPSVKLEVVDEDFLPRAGLAGLDERLFTTASAVARIWRGLDGRKRITLRASAEGPIGRHGAEFRWVLLRGNPELVTIETMDDGGSAAIELLWHDAFTVQTEDGPKSTNRVDIAVFALSEAGPGAPAFVSVSFPTHQIRTYETGADGRELLSAVDYDAAARGAAFDPLLFWTAPWRDTALRDEFGDLIGWERHDRDGTREVLITDALPTYRIVRPVGGNPILFETPR